MFKPLRAPALMSLALFLAFGDVAEAQAFGRVTVVVSNDAGKPLQGVEVTVTCDALPRFREELKTNKKGKAVVAVTDATQVYNFHFEYEDFQPSDMAIKPEIRGNTTREVTLTAGQIVATDKGSVTYTPAEKVYNEGVTAFKNGDLETAETQLLAALEKDEDMASAHSALVGVYMQQKNYPSALASAQRYRELQPDDANGLFMLYDIHTALGNQKEADEALEALKAADQSGDTVALIFNAGVAAYRVGNHTTAKARFLEALELNPDLDAAVGALALIFHREGDYQKAVGYAEKHLVMEPGDEQSMRIRWDAYDKLGEEEKAAAALKELAAADPKVVAVDFYNQGTKLFNDGDIASAQEQFERVLTVDPDHVKAHYQLGLCYINAGDNAAAKEHLQRFIELAPDDPDAALAGEMLKSLN